MDINFRILIFLKKYDSWGANLAAVLNIVGQEVFRCKDAGWSKSYFFFMYQSRYTGTYVNK